MSQVLSKESLSSIKGVAKPLGQEAKVGIAHIGIGAFHRAHQAVYTDDLLNLGDKNWKISAISLRSSKIKDAMAPQDYLYSVVERAGSENHTRIVGAIDQVLVAPKEPEAVLALLSNAQTKVVTLTVTEKGYCRDKSGLHLDEGNDAVAHDLTEFANLGEKAPKSVPGLLVKACEIRKSTNSPLTIISCDNLPSNGAVTRTIVMEFAAKVDKALVQWIESNVSFCNSMVDRIVPATTDADYTDIRNILGVADQSVVFTEPFKQWIIEDNFIAERPAWDKVGAIFVKDVEPFEDMKLRLLNGAHSALAYIGFLLGYEFIHEAVTDIDCAHFAKLLHQDVLPTVSAVPGIDLPVYADTILARFANQGVPYKTTQVACDGSQKLPQRLAAPALTLLEQGHVSKPIAFVLAAWCKFLEGKDSQGNCFSVTDPMAEPLVALANQYAHDSEMQVKQILSESGVCAPRLLKSEEFVGLVITYVNTINMIGVRGALKQVS